ATPLILQLRDYDSYFPQKRANAYVHPEGDAHHSAALAEFDGVRGKGGRKIVDAEEAEVLESTEGGRLAGAGEAADDDDGGAPRSLRRGCGRGGIQSHSPPFVVRTTGIQAELSLG